MRRLLCATVALTALFGAPAAEPPAAFAPHCGRCHALPDPGLLPAEDWPATVAWMGAYLGHPVQDTRFSGAVSGSLLPAAPLVEATELTAIARWLSAAAPSRAAVRAAQPPAREARVERLDSSLDPGPGRTATMLWAERGLAAAGFALPPALRVVESASGQALIDSPLPSEPVGCELRPEGGLRLSLLGHWAGDAGAGMVLDLGAGADGQLHVTPLVADYHRLAGHLSADLDADGRLDLLLLGFGDTPLGRLAVLWAGAAGWEEQVLFSGSGVVSALSLDVDQDGRLDVVAALAQQHNRLVWYRQTAPRRFEERLLLQRPLGWGLNQLLAADLDADGRVELIEVAGNNMEYPEPPLKPQHGLRILSLSVDGVLGERAFIPLFGATRCAVGDVDGDGRLDLVASAFYPDWGAELPLTALIARATADGNWTRERLPPALWNRWLTVAIDSSASGPARILLGGGAIPAAMPEAARARWLPRMQQAPSVLELRLDDGHD